MYCAETTVILDFQKEKKAAIRVKGQITDGPIAKNISYVMFYLCTKFHAFITK